jgi:tRNA nucleotidyltransferase/poly(A) polymerase
MSEPTAAQGAAPRAAPGLHLTAMESKIFEILIETASLQNKSTVLRAAGGWVRDKLLGLPSDDIDIAIDNQTGSEFAADVNQYLLNHGLETHTVAVIHANPEQSKHLETARMKILDLELDFVNLRTESYTTHSRIPNIAEEFGTPLEDALRRDFTINSLFYNLHTQQIEDFTGHGLDDLQIGILRTPLDAAVTFTDDPLRMLRAVRFSSRFNYRLHETIVEVASQTETHEALHLKVSKERQLKEISGCFSAQLCRPILAITTLHRLGLFPTVFNVPSFELLTGDLQAEASNSLFESIGELLERWQSLSFQCSFWTNCLLHLLSIASTPSCSSTAEATASLDLSAATLFPTSRYPIESFSSSEQRGPLWLPIDLLTAPMNDIPLSQSTTLHCSEIFWTCCVSSLAGVSVKEKKGKPILLAQAVLRDSLKVDNDTLKAVGLSLQAALSFRAIFPSFSGELEKLSSEEISNLRESLGLILRDCRSYWRAALVIACSLTLSINSMSPPGAATALALSVGTSVELTPHHLEIIQRYRHIGATVMSLHLDEIWTSKPHYDGDALVAELAMKRGPLLGKIIEKQFRWQLRYPQRPREECLEYLRQQVSLL